MRYKFEQFEAVIVDPEISIIMTAHGPNITNIDFVNLTYSVDILLKVEGAEMAVTIDLVKTPSLNFESQGSNMMNQIMERLNNDEFKPED